MALRWRVSLEVLESEISLILRCVISAKCLCRSCVHRAGGMHVLAKTSSRLLRYILCPEGRGWSHRSVIMYPKGDVSKCLASEGVSKQLCS